MKEVKRFKVKLEVSSTSKSVDVRLAEVLEWLVADPQVCALWPQLACQLGLSGQVPLLAVTRAGRTTDSHRLAALLNIWTRFTHPASLQQLCGALNAIGLRHAAEFLNLLYGNQRSRNVLKTEKQLDRTFKSCKNAFDRRCLSDSGISLASMGGVSTYPVSSHKSTENPSEDIFRLDIPKGERLKRSSVNCERSFQRGNPDHKMNWSGQDLMSPDLNRIESFQNGKSMRGKSNSGEFCLNSFNIQDSNRSIPDANHSSYQPKRKGKEENDFELNQEKQTEVGLVLDQSGKISPNGTFSNQDECDRSLESESEGEIQDVECLVMENDKLSASSKVKDLADNTSALYNLDSFESGQDKTSELQPKFEENDSTHERLKSTDPVLDFRVQSPEDGYFSNKEESQENPSPLKKGSLGPSRTGKSLDCPPERDYDSMLDSSLEIDSSLQTLPATCGIQDLNSSSDAVRDNPIETDVLLQSHPGDLPQPGSNTETELKSSKQTGDGLQNSRSKIQEERFNVKKSWSVNPLNKTQEPNAVKTFRTVESDKSIDQTDKNMSCFLKVAENNHPMCHSSPKHHHDDLVHFDWETSSPSVEKLQRPGDISPREKAAAPLTRGITISLDKAGTSVSFDERGHIVPLEEIGVSGGRRGKGVFETLFRPEPRYWPKLLAAGWIKRGVKEQRQCSRYATVRNFLKRKHSLSRSFPLKRSKGEVGFYFDNLVTILKASVIGI